MISRSSESLDKIKQNVDSVGVLVPVVGVFNPYCTTKAG